MSGACLGDVSRKLGSLPSLLRKIGPARGEETYSFSAGILQESAACNYVV